MAMAALTGLPLHRPASSACECYSFLLNFGKAAFTYGHATCAYDGFCGADPAIALIDFELFLMVSYTCLLM